jgi:hypothetical protein
MKLTKILEQIISEAKLQFYHGSTDKNLSGKNGIHVGSKLAATQALESRIGVPAQGEWDGTKEYGKTLLAGKKTLQRLDKERGYYVTTGFNAGSDVPEEDYLPTQRKERAEYSDGTKIPMESKPIIFPVKIVGQMNNTPNWGLKTDVMANSLMMRGLRKGNVKNGFYYINDGEDEGSISAVVPNKDWLQY